MNFIIVEDEIFNLRMLKGMISVLRPEWVCIGELKSVEATVDWLTNNIHPDLVFMDIQLADGICFSIFEQVQLQIPVIFTTAYDNYAIQAFKVNSIDYLLKPVKDADLELAITKFEGLNKSYSSTELIDYSQIYAAIKNGEKKYRTRFLIHGCSYYQKIEADDIAYFYSENKITFAVTFNKKENIIDFTLDGLEEELNPDKFFRINRQILVNIESIEKIEDYFNGKLILKTIPPIGEPITVSRLKASAFKRWMGK